MEPYLSSESDGDVADISSLVRHNDARGPALEPQVRATTSIRVPSRLGTSSASQGSDDSQGSMSSSRHSSIQPHDRASKFNGARARPVVVVHQPSRFAFEDYPLISTSQIVRKVLREVEDPTANDLGYEVQFSDGLCDIVKFTDILSLRNGSRALESFERGESSTSSSGTEPASMVHLRSKRSKVQREPGFVDTTKIDLSGDDTDNDIADLRRRGTNNADHDGMSTPPDPESEGDSNENSDPTDSDEEPRRSGRLRNNKSTRLAGGRYHSSLRRSTRKSSRSAGISGSNSSEDELNLLVSDIMPRSRKRKRSSRTMTFTRNGLNFDAPRPDYRRSNRDTRARGNMAEVGEDVLERSASASPKPQVPKVVGLREVFKPIPHGNSFRDRHRQVCDTCDNAGNTSGALIYCQGCSLAYHKHCLGVRKTRDHLVTKVGENEFVLQCRRCVNMTRQKNDPMAPDMATCQDCHESGQSCIPFRSRKTPAQEQKDREENDGVDPITTVNRSLINNAQGLLFRCTKCFRGFHFHHLPSRLLYPSSLERTDKELADERWTEYCRDNDWRCKDCHDMPSKIQTLVAWRPVDPETYTPGVLAENIGEDDKEYLVKYDGFSYFQVEWKSGAWVWGVTTLMTRKAFFKKDQGPKMATEDAVPEEYLRIDIVLDIAYTNKIDIRTDEIDRARIKEVAKALIKYKGLTYEDAVWEKVPTPDDGERWTDFVTAYNDWVLGRYIHLPKGKPLSGRLEKMRDTPFAQLEKKKQPESLIGGELMKYQIDGLNWLFYQWYLRRNGILADEMGLGKTIQVIAFLALLVTDYNCFPFLLVVPNSTCPNWRREIKKWAPSLRVVTYFGSSAARDMANRYELFPEGATSLKCHIVVTSYEAAADPNCKRFFKSVPWQGLIVDEGQRLKNDKSILHTALENLKIPFRILLTGTPLQNNARELFNLLHFLDDTINAQQMEDEYAEMDNVKIARLHELIRPFILRRTKAQVLTFLPPMAQIILPVTMSVLQQKVYKSILSKSPDLLRAIFSSNPLKPAERSSLNNILMQLRKVLCHPFIYSQEIEERQQSAAVLHRNLVEASSKLQLLELLLPKLQERGHRVLIFSQFLGMLTIVEDFLDGLQMRYQRLDGNTSSLEKQKRIDEFNAPGSQLFAFLLSTRAGGVGINLASADTVIILDPDFNPHQDLQALSRAHRIGQKKKVLCFQLMTRHSAEEKIVQIGRKKMALDHVVVDQMDAEDLEEKDVASILRHGATALFSDDRQDDIKYDDSSVDRLLDRSQIENTRAAADGSAESQFSFARIWANENATMKETIDDEADVAPDTSVWEKILKDREKAAAAEAAARAEVFGRGRRARMAVDYSGADGEKVTDLPAAASPQDPNAAKESLPEIDKTAATKTERRRKKTYEDSDTDFMAHSSSESEDAMEPNIAEDAASLTEPIPANVTRGLAAPTWDKSQETSAKSAPLLVPNTTTQQRAAPIEASTPATRANNDAEPKADMVTAPPVVQLAKRTKPPGMRKFKRANVEPPRMPPNPLDLSAMQSNGTPYPAVHHCLACNSQHLIGSCPLKIAGVEQCPLCGLAHYGHARVCPHIKSETQVKLMIDALKMSPEPRHLVDAALKYLRGVKGTLVAAKKQARERAELAAIAPQAGNGPRVTIPYPSAGTHAPVEERLLAALGPPKE